MTLYVLDVASYQGDLTTTDVVRAGFGGVNLKVSHGLTQRSVHPDVTGWVSRSRAAGLDIGTFHWLDGNAPGAEQAAYAFERLTALDLTEGTVHTVDCESSATEEILSSYVAAMQARLGRPVFIYSADWWWESRRWNGAALTPYLWGAPNQGYLASYPGDTSPHWVAGWGGWPTFSAMQYTVGPLLFPDGKAGTINVSKTAVRDLDAWTVLKGGDSMASWVLVPSLITLREEFNRLAPARDKRSDGSIGDTAHSQSVSDHNPDETGNTGGMEDADSINEVHAIDVDRSGPWPEGFSMEEAVQYLVRECRAGREKRLRYIIYNKRIWSASSGWVQKAYSGGNPHTEHAHFSAAYGSGSGSGNPENDTSSYGLKGLVDDVPLTEAEYDKIADKVVERFAADLGKTTPLATQMRAAAWKYIGGGIPQGMSTLNVLNATYNGVSNLEAASQAEVVRDAAMGQALLTALNEIRQGATDPVTEEELYEALRRVYGEAFDQEQAPPPPPAG